MFPHSVKLLITKLTETSNESIVRLNSLFLLYEAVMNEVYNFKLSLTFILNDFLSVTPVDLNCIFYI